MGWRGHACRRTRLRGLGGAGSSRGCEEEEPCPSAGRDLSSANFFRFPQMLGIHQVAGPSAVGLPARRLPGVSYCPGLSCASVCLLAIPAAGSASWVRPWMHTHTLSAAASGSGLLCIWARGRSQAHGHLPRRQVHLGERVRAGPAGGSSRAVAPGLQVADAQSSVLSEASRNQLPQREPRQQPLPQARGHWELWPLQRVGLGAVTFSRLLAVTAMDSKLGFSNLATIQPLITFLPFLQLQSPPVRALRLLNPSFCRRKSALPLTCFQTPTALPSGSIILPETRESPGICLHLINPTG